MTEVSARRISLTMGPLLFNWPAGKISDFYARLADEAPVDTVHIGETVCSKRLPFYADAIAGAVERLQRAGKTVILSTLALITLPREQKESAEIVHNGEYEAEVNDITALAHLSDSQRFRIGPTVNVYNESTLRYLSELGAVSVCLPPELPIATVEILAAQARALNVECEVWAFGRIPLAISGRCYHARIDGLSKDSCQFVCARDSDGLAISTVDGKKFLALNGVQTLSHSYCNLAGDTDRLMDAGVTALRLSPQDCDMVAIARTFRDRLDGKCDSRAAIAAIQAVCGDVPFSNGFLFGKAGAEMVYP